MDIGTWLVIGFRTRVAVAALEPGWWWCTVIQVGGGHWNPGDGGLKFRYNGG